MTIGPAVILGRRSGMVAAAEVKAARSKSAG